MIRVVRLVLGTRELKENVKNYIRIDYFGVTHAGYALYLGRVKHVLAMLPRKCSRENPSRRQVSKHICSLCDWISCVSADW